MSEIAVPKRPLSELIVVLHHNLDTLVMVLDGTWGKENLEDPLAVKHEHNSEVAGRLEEHQEALENAIKHIQGLRERLLRLSEQI